MYAVAVSVSYTSSGSPFDKERPWDSEVWGKRWQMDTDCKHTGTRATETTRRWTGGLDSMQAEHRLSYPLALRSHCLLTASHYAAVTGLTADPAWPENPDLLPQPYRSKPGWNHGLEEYSRQGKGIQQTVKWQTISTVSFGKGKPLYKLCYSHWRWRK